MFERIIKEVARDFKIDNQKPPEKYRPLIHKSPTGTNRNSFLTTRKVKPKIGSLVATSLTFGFLDHSGIYIGNGMIIEQHGNHTLKKVSFEKFQNGDNEIKSRGLSISIQIACDSNGNPLSSKEVAKRAIELYNNKERRFKEYDIISNNCHQFSWHCISGDYHDTLTKFSTLEERVARFYGYRIYWDDLDINYEE